ncbi:MAG: hypothetical protein AAGI48_10975 [Verrucomicrobiota bacterium]
MRGSPLIRTLIVVVALAFTGFGLSKLGAKRTVTIPPPTEEEASPAAGISTPFTLTLSAQAREAILESGDHIETLTPDDQVLAGRLMLQPGHPTVFITVKWKDDEASPRFAKLVLEPAGFPTLTRVFDARGDISDVWEFHLHD